jgi:A/G-specific adenine glycosylase
MIKTSTRKRKPAEALLAWYDAHKRDLPWRARPGERADPYAVWLSEIMLQQTTVAAAKSYYEKFLTRWPNVEALAAAPLEDVLAQWAGLGYYARARNLHACARAVTAEHGGRFPREERALLRLPGIGPYTAGAIAAIAYNEPCVAIDGNAERVIARLFAIESPLRSAKPLIREKALKLLPSARPGDFAQAMMDLGATVCAPRAPNCVSCPLQADCEAHRRGEPERRPFKDKKPQKPLRRGAIFILQRGEEALLRRRSPNGLLGGMNAFPSTPLTQDVAPKEQRRFAPCAARWRALGEPVTHVFTHFSFQATVFVARAEKTAKPPEDCRWAARANLDREGLPTLMRKAALRVGLVAKMRER